MHLVAIGGSDAGISAALRSRELDPDCDVTVVVADAYPNFSICGIPYYVSGEVTHWRHLAHRTTADLEATGMQLRLDTVARRIDVSDHKSLSRTLMVEKIYSRTTPWWSEPVHFQCVLLSLAWPDRTPLALPTACTCSTQWVTPLR
jgi:hypothetical protein